MEIIKWSEDFECGIRAFDEEHKFLVETLNRIFELLKEGKKEEAKELLKIRVVEYTKKHFKHEEEIMKKYNYPEYERHKKIHDTFVKVIVQNELKKIDENEVNLRYVVSFLIGWLIMHIQKADKKYAEWFKEKNITINDSPMSFD
ncbi:bacteriohemerythrin [Methanocaldococcus indicus]|uniref:bacteriohemerythrin n=1 Tax=Methanocaldococcus indicus TaxID=213231 RepID=UPI003C6D303A